MNIYLISQSVNDDYDTWDSAVVIAESESMAKCMHPDKDLIPTDDCRYDDEDDEYYIKTKWAMPCDVTVELIGNTGIGTTGATEPRIVCSSFNAG